MHPSREEIFPLPHDNHGVVFGAEPWERNQGRENKELPHECLNALREAGLQEPTDINAMKACKEYLFSLRKGLMKLAQSSLSIPKKRTAFRCMLVNPYYGWQLADIHIWLDEENEKQFFENISKIKTLGCASVRKFRNSKEFESRIKKIHLDLEIIYNRGLLATLQRQRYIDYIFVKNDYEYRAGMCAALYCAGLLGSKTNKEAKEEEKEIYEKNWKAVKALSENERDGLQGSIDHRMKVDKLTAYPQDCFELILLNPSKACAIDRTYHWCFKAGLFTEPRGKINLRRFQLGIHRIEYVHRLLDRKLQITDERGYSLGVHQVDLLKGERGQINLNKIFEIILNFDRSAVWFAINAFFLETLSLRTIYEVQAAFNRMYALILKCHPERGKITEEKITTSTLPVQAFSSQKEEYFEERRRIAYAHAMQISAFAKVFRPELLAILSSYLGDYSGYNEKCCSKDDAQELAIAKSLVAGNKKRANAKPIKRHLCVVIKRRLIGTINYYADQNLIKGTDTFEEVLSSSFTSNFNAVFQWFGLAESREPSFYLKPGASTGEQIRRCGYWALATAETETERDRECIFAVSKGLKKNQSTLLYDGIRDQIFTGISSNRYTVCEKSCGLHKAIISKNVELTALLLAWIENPRGEAFPANEVLTFSKSDSWYGKQETFLYTAAKKFVECNDKESGKIFYLLLSSIEPGSSFEENERAIILRAVENYCEQFAPVNSSVRPPRRQLPLIARWTLLAASLTERQPELTPQFMSVNDSIYHSYGRRLQFFSAAQSTALSSVQPQKSHSSSVPTSKVRKWTVLAASLTDREPQLMQQFMNMSEEIHRFQGQRPRYEQAQMESSALSVPISACTVR